MDNSCKDSTPFELAVLDKDIADTVEDSTPCKVAAAIPWGCYLGTGKRCVRLIVHSS